MTTLDEALRALKKKYETRLANWTRLYEQDQQNDADGRWNRAHMLQCQDVLDDIRALLTTRQEVAPVAWEYRYQYANGEWSDWIRKSEEYVERTKVHLSMEGITCETRALYTSTGQTSDARDVVLDGEEEENFHGH